MAERRPEQASLVVESDQPLIAVPLEENGRAVEQYFVDAPLADLAGSEQSIQEALSLGGVWSDLDWEDMERELHRIGHENPPTPPIDEL